MVELALETAMRRGELLNARWSDLSLIKKTLHIPVTKNDHPRTIPLTARAIALMERLKELSQGDEWIIPITLDSMRMAWKRVLKRAKLDDLHFHDLRHEAISRFFEHGLSIPEVAMISGHRDPRMLFRYTHPKPELVAEKLARATEGALYASARHTPSAC
jgi:integrase